MMGQGMPERWKTGLQERTDGWKSIQPMGWEITENLGPWSPSWYPSVPPSQKEGRKLVESMYVKMLRFGFVGGQCPGNPGFLWVGLRELMLCPGSTRHVSG